MKAQIRSAALRQPERLRASGPSWREEYLKEELEREEGRGGGEEGKRGGGRKEGEEERGERNREERDMERGGGEERDDSKRGERKADGRGGEVLPSHYKDVVFGMQSQVLIQNWKPTFCSYCI